MTRSLEDRSNLVFHEVAQTLGSVASRPDGGDDPFGRGHADVGGDEQFLEFLERFNVDAPGTRVRRVSPFDEFVEPSDELLFRPGQAVPKAIEEPHRAILVRPSGPRLFPLRALRTQHQLFDRRPWIRVAVQDRLHLRGNR